MGDYRRFLRILPFSSLMLLVTLLMTACASGGQSAPANPGAGEPPPGSNTAAPARATFAPVKPSTATGTPMDDDTVTVDLTNPTPPTRQPLPAGRTRIYGRVLDPQGAPIPGAAVTIPRGTSPVPERAALTDKNGSYNWVLLPGIYTVQVNASGFQTAQADADTQLQAQVELNFALEPE